MADYVPFMRSHYFAVKNRAAFEQFCADYDLTLVKAVSSSPRRNRGEELVGFRGNGETGIRTGKYHPEKDE